MQERRERNDRFKHKKCTLNILLYILFLDSSTLPSIVNYADGIFMIFLTADIVLNVHLCVYVQCSRHEEAKSYKGPLYI